MWEMFDGESVSSDKFILRKHGTWGFGTQAGSNLGCQEMLGLLVENELSAITGNIFEKAGH